MANVTRLQTAYSNLPVEAPPSVSQQQPQGDPSPSVSVRNILGMLRRHKLLIGGVALIGTTIAWLIANQLTPVYQAQADIVIEGSTDTSIINPNQGAGPLDVNMEAEAAKLKSETAARISVRALNLIEHPLFNPDLAPPQQGKFKALFAPLLKLVGAGGAAPPSRLPPEEVRRRLEAMPPDQKDPFYNQIAGAWAAGLSTAIPMYSRVMSVRYRSSDPQLAAQSVNQAIRTYMDQQTSDKKQDALELMRFLSTQTETARKAVVEAEGKLAEFRAANQIYDTGDASTQTRQLIELQAQLLSAEKELREKSARADNGMLPNDTTLLGELASAEKRVAELGAQLGPTHPAMVSARQQLGAVQARVNAERGRVIANQRRELEATRISVDKLRTEVTRLEEQIKRQTVNLAQLRTLQTELDTRKQYYQALLSRFQEVSLTGQQQRKSMARPLSDAETPNWPVAPRKDLIVLMAFVASLALGVAVAIVIELMDSGFRSIHQLEQMTGVAALGMVPFQSGRLRRNAKPWMNIVDKPNSAYSEALRTIRTGIQLSSADHPQRTVVVTSSVPGEGKTTTSLSLAAASAASGARTLLIDCDLRQPSAHKNLGVENEAGLAEFLSGQRNLEELVHVEPRTGLYYILAGKRPPSPTDLLGSLRMRRLLQQLGDAFDLVVLDTPPVLAVSDALLLVRQADTTIFVVRWEKTRRDIASTGVKMVYEAGARLSGIVLTQVDLRRHAQYDYTDSGVYYYRGYKKYYGE
ncbi:MAG: polysaccharide biosynthesis tyrosine autokinase [Alphaproteobacteria bacterium]|nr:polysaccharide biosynthesis tyrosine autokinase [Alphaproteobacteria bacterium]MCW5740913.1 polysaccharide biosynthesis tyrosine autokinase [Alphaproteobacteria bacterium]